MSKSDHSKRHELRMFRKENRRTMTLERPRQWAITAGLDEDLDARILMDCEAVTFEFEGGDEDLDDQDDDWEWDWQMVAEAREQIRLEDEEEKEREIHESLMNDEEHRIIGWMPVMRLAEARAHFGEAWERGFHITTRP